MEQNRAKKGVVVKMMTRNLDKAKLLGCDSSHGVVAQEIYKQNVIFDKIFPSLHNYCFNIKIIQVNKITIITLNNYFRHIKIKSRLLLWDGTSKTLKKKANFYLKQ